MKANEIREETRKKVAKQYTSKIQELQNQLKELRIKYSKVCTKSYEIMEENQKLHDKLYEYEDWINRLQEFVNMDSEERDKAIRKYHQDQAVTATMEALFNHPLFKHLYNVWL